MPILYTPEFDHHEQVQFCHDKATGLKAIIAVHNTRLGPALGGCRMWPYADEQQALNDVLRLSRGMTYKSALARLPLGGGKAVIVVIRAGQERSAVPGHGWFCRKHGWALHHGC